MTATGTDETERAIRRIMNEAVANGRVDGDEAFAALMRVAAKLVAQVDDIEKRLTFIEMVMTHFGPLVEALRRDHHMVNVERNGETLQ